MRREGNPLYVEQLAALAETRRRSSSPPTIQALLAERLDRLEAGERDDPRARRDRRQGVLARGAVTDLSPAGAAPRRRPAPARARAQGAHLPEPHASASSARTASASATGSIRDAAYDGDPEGARAALPRVVRRLARAQRGRAADRDRGDRRLPPRAGRTAARRARAGRRRGTRRSPRRAVERARRRRAGARSRRDDMPAAREPARPGGLARHRRRPGAARADARALERVLDGRRADAGRGSAGRADRDGARGRRPAPGVVRAARARLAPDESPTRSGTADELHETAHAAIDVFAELGDELGLARAWRAAAQGPRRACRFAETETALEHGARARAERRGRPGGGAHRRRTLHGAARRADAGETAIRRCEALLAESGRNLLLEANVLGPYGGLLGLRGDFEEARTARSSRARSIYHDLGLAAADRDPDRDRGDGRAARRRSWRRASRCCAKATRRSRVPAPGRSSPRRVAAPRRGRAAPGPGRGGGAAARSGGTDDAGARPARAGAPPDRPRPARGAGRKRRAGASSRPRRLPPRSADRRADAARRHRARSAQTCSGSSAAAATRPSRCGEALELYVQKGHLVGAERVRAGLLAGRRRRSSRRRGRRIRPG